MDSKLRSKPGAGPPVRSALRLESSSDGPGFTRVDAFVPDVDGPVGWARVRHVPQCELAGLFVEAHLRGRGVGGALVEGAQAAAQSKHCQSLHLVRHGSPWLEGFYRSHGFDTIVGPHMVWKAPESTAVPPTVEQASPFES